MRKIRGQRLEVRGQKKDKNSLFYVFCLLFSVFCFFAKTAPALAAEDVLKKTREELLQQNIKFRDQISDLEREMLKQKKYSEQLEKKAKDFFLKTKELELQTKNLNNLYKMVDSLNKQKAALKTENTKFSQEIDSLKENFRKENADICEKLGTAYVQAKLYDLAIDAYEKSLVYNSCNADVHYNLGLLYKKSEDNISKSIHHFKKYLSLKPKAKNREEVKYLINMLAAKGKLPVEIIF